MMGGYQVKMNLRPTTEEDFPYAVLLRTMYHSLLCLMTVLHVAYRLAGDDRQPPDSVNINAKFVQELIGMSD